jgi:hypothetical protein
MELQDPTHATHMIPDICIDAVARTKYAGHGSSTRIYAIFTEPQMKDNLPVYWKSALIHRSTLLKHLLSVTFSSSPLPNGMSLDKFAPQPNEPNSSAPVPPMLKGSVDFYTIHHSEFWFDSLLYIEE